MSRYILECSDSSDIKIDSRLIDRLIKADDIKSDEYDRYKHDGFAHFILTDGTVLDGDGEGAFEDQTGRRWLSLDVMECDEDGEPSIGFALGFFRA